MSDNLKDIVKDAVKDLASEVGEAVEQKVVEVATNAIAPNNEDSNAEQVENKQEVCEEPAVDNQPTAAPKSSTKRCKEDKESAQSALGAVASTAAKVAKSQAGGKAVAAKTFTAVLQPLLPYILGGLVIAGIGGFIAIEANKELKIEDTANVVEEVKKISEFTTACYYEERVLKADRDDHITKKNIFKTTEKDVHNEIILTVKGTVRAGFDLSKLDEDDMVVRGDTIAINLPQPEIFDVISNPSDYRIFEEEGKWSHEEIVEIQSNGKMETLNNALHSGILAKANKNGAIRVKELFASFGFSVVEVTLSEGPTSEVPAEEEPEETVEAPAEEVAPEVEAPVEESVEALAEETEAE